MGQENSDKQMDLMQGTLDLLILKAVSLGSLHGYGGLLRIQQIPSNRSAPVPHDPYPADVTPLDSSNRVAREMFRKEPAGNSIALRSQTGFATITDRKSVV